MSDHTLYNFTRGNGDAPRQRRVYFNIETIVTRYLAYQSVWVAVGEELPCQREQANSPRGSLFCCCSDGEKFPWFAQCLYNKIGQSFVRLLDPQLEDNSPGFLNSLEFLEEEVLQERIFAS